MYPFSDLQNLVSVAQRIMYYYNISNIGIQDCPAMFLICFYVFMDIQKSGMTYRHTALL